MLNVHIKELIVIQLVTHFPFFMEPEGPLPCLYVPTTGPYPEST
jgi:hypothetical protein